MRARIAIAPIVLAAGLALTACGESEDEKDRARQEATEIVADARQDAKALVQNAEEQVAELEEEADKARDDRRSDRRKLKRLRGELDRLRDQIDSAETRIAESTVPGTGTFIVGEDIEPGIYRAEPSPGCYWARLASLDTSDIIDNNNADGPVVVEVLASDRALELSGCADLVRQR